jgi:hypothetical protein
MPPISARNLETLERFRAEFGRDAAATKHAALRALESARLPSADRVRRLHECLCFLRAYPDTAALLAQVERMLDSFERRPDLRRHARTLANSGIAGTAVHFSFFADTAAWLAGRHPGRLRVDWGEFAKQDALERVIHLLALYSETPGLDEYAFPMRAWVRRLKGPNETDAEFLVRRFQALCMSGFAREALYDSLDLPLALGPGPGVPSRTTAKLAGAPVVFQDRAMDRARPDLRRSALRVPRAVVALSPDQGRRIVDLAREAMVVRVRDLDAFCYGDPRDVRLVQWEDGLQFAVIGVIPERRLMLESVYAYLTLKNGVPIGYVLISALFGSSEIAYNVFDTWRGAEAARIYARVLATTRHLFGSDTFTIYPYQLGGHGNDEGLRSGAWWFYRKLGFAPRDPGAMTLMRREEGRMAAHPGHRSSLATLRALATSNLYLALGRPRRDVIGMLELANAGLHVTRFLAGNFGAGREKGAGECARAAARLLDVRRAASWPAARRLWWERWSPLMLILPDVERWTAAEKRALVEVVHAKAGGRESEFVRRFDRHRRLREAVRALAREIPE